MGSHKKSMDCLNSGHAVSLSDFSVGLSLAVATCAREFLDFSVFFIIWSSKLTPK